MQVVLHIGTHKTGTSTIQSVLANNRALLTELGVHYPLCRYSARNVNFIGARLINRNYQEPEDFIKKAIKNAEAKGCHTVLLSGESMYAMTGLFRNLLNRPVDDYWAEEEAAIQALATMLNGVDVKIVCYVRRQDLFLEALYNQFVKQAPGYSGDLKSFIAMADPTADYAGHLDVWAKVFGHDTIVVRVFDDVSGALMDDFVKTALKIDDVSAFQFPSRHINERISPNLLLFKRVVNRLRMPLIEDHVASGVIRRMARTALFNEMGGSFMSSKDKNALMAEFDVGNNRVAESYCGLQGKPLFQRPENSGDVPISNALSLVDGMEIYMHYRREMSRPRIKIEILIRSIIRGVLDRAPWLEYVLGGVRRAVNWRRLSREWQG